MTTPTSSGSEEILRQRQQQQVSSAQISYRTGCATKRPAAAAAAAAAATTTTTTAPASHHQQQYMLMMKQQQQQQQQQQNIKAPSGGKGAPRFPGPKRTTSAPAQVGQPLVAAQQMFPGQAVFGQHPGAIRGGYPVFTQGGYPYFAQGVQQTGGNPYANANPYSQRGQRGQRHRAQTKKDVVVPKKRAPLKIVDPKTGKALDLGGKTANKMTPPPSADSAKAAAKRAENEQTKQEEKVTSDNVSTSEDGEKVIETKSSIAATWREQVEAKLKKEREANEKADTGTTPEAKAEAVAETEVKGEVESGVEATAKAETGTEVVKEVNEATSQPKQSALEERMAALKKRKAELEAAKAAKQTAQAAKLPSAFEKKGVVATKETLPKRVAVKRPDGGDRLTYSLAQLMELRDLPLSTEHPKDFEGLNLEIIQVSGGGGGRDRGGGNHNQGHQQRGGHRQRMGNRVGGPMSGRPAGFGPGGRMGMNNRPGQQFKRGPQQQPGGHNSSGGGQWTKGQTVPVRHNNNNNNNRHNRGHHQHQAPSTQEKLAVSEWVKKKRSDKKTISAHDKAVQNVRAILNKLTRENFGVLSDKVLAIDIVSVRLLKDIIAAVFEKALTEPHFGEIYADLCRTLAEAMSENVGQWSFVEFIKMDDGFYWTSAVDQEEEGCFVGPFESEDVAKKEAKRATNFKRILLNNCQEEFEKEDVYAEQEARMSEINEQLAPMKEDMKNEAYVTLRKEKASLSSGR